MMKENRIIFFSCIILLTVSGCVKLRDYVSAEHGFLSLRVKNTFGEGHKVRDYFVTQNGDIINTKDTSSYLLQILGSPDEVDSSFSGYKVWIYRKSKVMFFIEDNIIKHIYAYEPGAVKKE